MILLFLCVSLTISLSLVSNKTITTSGYKGIQPVIIIDDGHSQVFNYTLIQSAIDILESEFDADIIIHDDPFTLTNIRGADLLILPAPSIYTDSNLIEDLEKQAVVEFYQDGGSVLYLANPYFFDSTIRNYSSNLVNINSFMGTVGSGDTYGTLSFNSRQVTLMNDFSNRFGDEQFIYINNDTMNTDHAIINGFNDVQPVDEILTFSSYVIDNFDSDQLINTSLTTYEVNNDGEVPFGGTKEYTILAADEKYNGRGISCASAIMFSDLQIVENDSTTWYEAFDNALLWKNMIAWLIQDIPQVQAPNPLPEYGLFVVSIISIFFVLMVLGSVLFTVGRDTKKVEVSEVITKMRERADRRKKIDQEIDEAYYTEAEDIPETEVTPKSVEVEEKEVDMKTISDELKKKPPKTRSRSEKRRQR